MAKTEQRKVDKAPVFSYRHVVAPSKYPPAPRFRSVCNKC